MNSGLIVGQQWDDNGGDNGIYISLSLSSGKLTACDKTTMFNG